MFLSQILPCPLLSSPLVPSLFPSHLLYLVLLLFLIVAFPKFHSFLLFSLLASLFVPLPPSFILYSLPFPFRRFPKFMLFLRLILWKDTFLMAYKFSTSNSLPAFFSITRILRRQIISYFSCNCEYLDDKSDNPVWSEVRFLFFLFLFLLFLVYN